MACLTTLLLFCFLVAGISAYPLDNKQENETAKDSFQPVSLPTDFGSYDPNANGYIDLEELAKVTGTKLDDARKPFMDADIDDDDQVSPSEFERAPWTLSAFNREELVPEDDNADQTGSENDEEDIHTQEDSDSDDHIDDSDDYIEDDSDDYVDDSDDHSDGQSQDYSDDSIQDDSDDDRSIFGNGDDMLVDVGKPVTEGDADGSVKTEDEITEESLEEEDDESRIVDSDEDDIDENEEEGDDYDDISDPLLEDDDSKQQPIITEEEFVENAIY